MERMESIVTKRTNPTTEVVEKPTRRRFTAEYKLRVLAQADRCSELGQIGEVLRREGLYSSHLSNWRRQRDEGVLAGLVPKRRGRKVKPKNPLADEVAKLQRQNRRLEEKLLGGEMQEPFFLGAGIFQPHLPNYAPQEYFDRFPLEEIKLPEGFREDDLDDVPAAHAKMAHNPWLKRIREAGQWKPAIQAYLACTAMVDDLIGQIVRALEQSKYADNTIIVLWSDHGFQLGEKERWTKYSLWERATRVNLVWVAPGVTKPGSTSTKPVNLLDIYPTLASLTGIEPPEGQLEGNDLSVLMKDPGVAWNETTLTTFGYKNYGLRSEQHRYIVYADGSEELYDHAKDKWEWRNLADDPEYAEIKAQMRKGIPAHHEPLGALQGAFDRKRTSR